ncbi:MAG: DNA cytosine methyltransferase [Candidatus Actinomarinaceae bacterium]
MNKLKVIDLFSGIGGFSLGLHSTDIFETIKFVEFDKFCQRVLKKNFPNVPIEGDIRNVKGEEFEADVITGGFPCQPFSVAGRQKGTDDNRYLWPEMFRLIKEVKPEFVIGENVQGLVNLQNGMVLRQVQNDLEGEGFEVQCFLIPASGIGAWHRRNRVWIVGHSKHNGLLATEKRTRDKEINGGSSKGQKETIKLEGTSGPRNNEDVSNTNQQRTQVSIEGQHTSIEVSGGSSKKGRIESKDVSNTESIRRGESRNIDQEEGVQESSTTQFNSSSEDVSNTDSGMRRRRGTIEQSRADKIWGFYSEEEKQTNLDLWSEIIRRNVISGETQTLSNTNSKGSEGHGVSTELETMHDTENNFTETNHDRQQTWWQTESSFCGIPDGISYGLDKGRGNRIKSLGNAIVPQMARIFGLAIKKVLETQ